MASAHGAPVVLSLDSRVVAARDQISCNLSGEIVILSVESGLYFGLDQVGARVWELIQQPRSVSEIVDLLIQEYDVDEQRCGHDVLELLDEMQRRQLIEVAGEPLTQR
jgi:hypothetical protein